jgi:hypothetical protein
MAQRVGKDTIVFYDSGGNLIAHPQRFKMYKRTPVEKELDLEMVGKLYVQGLTTGQIAAEVNKVRGYSLGINQIGKDVQECLHRWRQNQLISMDTIVQRELVRINFMESQYWKGWFMSLEDYDEEERVTINDAKNPAIGSKTGRADRKKESMETRGLEDFEGAVEFIVDEAEAKSKIEPEEAEEMREEGHRPMIGDRRLIPSWERVKKITKGYRGQGNPEFLKGVERCIDLRMRILGIGQDRTVNINWRKQAEEAGVSPDALVDGLTEQFVNAAMGGGSYGRSLAEGAEDRSPQDLDQ